jgi:hypothetical protein
MKSNTGRSVSTCFFPEDNLEGLVADSALAFGYAASEVGGRARLVF